LIDDDKRTQSLPNQTSEEGYIRFTAYTHRTSNNLSFTYNPIDVGPSAGPYRSGIARWYYTPKTDIESM
jgi:hypothetical protein